jgi:hypothetical protein
LNVEVAPFVKSMSLTLVAELVTLVVDCQEPVLYCGAKVVEDGVLRRAVGLPAQLPEPSGWSLSRSSGTCR